MRHDGTEIAVGEERFITTFDSKDDEMQLSSMGIRRWKLQKVLIEEAQKRGIQIMLNQRVEKVQILASGMVQIKMLNGTEILCDLLFGFNFNRL